MSNVTREQLQQQLDTAEQELDIWERQRFTREDGSPAQDRRFEERGENLGARISDLSRQLNQLNEDEHRDTVNTEAQ
ncbi:hypothetical protein IYR97_23670 (plasmid) [Pseudomonas fulva]|jgi:hypothetical protein|uniref:Uncharacterized protein n=2 Tax=Pseudomonas putida group TaxID=136845 RepID=A0A1X0ZJC2_PSEPU|nr:MULTISPECIES: hypothetical protein [Pseudomonas]MCT8164042.1 hypothetical protein [Pseudomonas sp. HD6422]MCT8182970.1 hypothetical protein [Pseudomonas sp. HD6421]MDH1930433.1 hypothetical protein [Pseudomonas sp. GD03696]MDM1711761.1 hypothetical protein [Pseudomonas sp. 165]ORL53062.1 hypothetical protein B7H18_03505 [Pseudomonas putida]